MKLFILEETDGSRWIPVSFIIGDYRASVNGLGDIYDTYLSRVRRVRSLEECLELEGCLIRETVPVDPELDLIQTVSPDLRKDIEWME
jgi:hypothetical protein